MSNGKYDKVIDFVGGTVIAMGIIVPCVVVGKYVGMANGCILAGYLGVKTVQKIRENNVQRIIADAYNYTLIRSRERVTRSRNSAEVVPAGAAEESVVPKQRARRRSTA